MDEFGSAMAEKSREGSSDLDVVFLGVLVGVFALFLQYFCVIRRGNRNFFLLVVCDTARLSVQHSIVS